MSGPNRPSASGLRKWSTPGEEMKIFKMPMLDAGSKEIAATLKMSQSSKGMYSFTNTKVECRIQSWGEKCFSGREFYSQRVKTHDFLHIPR